jgi:hypothetical protein
VAKPADGYGKMPKLTIASHCSVSGANTEKSRGPSCSNFWGMPNLQVINRDAHVAKCAVEAGGRRAVPSPPSETTGQAALGGTS